MFMRKLFPCLVLFACACCSYNNPPATNGTPAPAPATTVAAPTPDVHCTPHGNNGSKTGAIVCIDASTLDADTATVKQGVWMHFYLTDQSQELDVTFKEMNVAEYKGHVAGANEVWLRIKDNAPTGTHSYTAKNVTTGQQKDPDVLIEP
jgi:hypothetical protein